MSYDILSDVLRGVRLRGAVFYYMSYGREWAAEAPAAQEIASAVLPGADHVIEYHAITKGSGWAAVLGEQPVRLEAGVPDIPTCTFRCLLPAQAYPDHDDPC